MVEAAPQQPQEEPRFSEQTMNLCALLRETAEERAEPVAGPKNSAVGCSVQRAGAWTLLATRRRSRLEAT